MQGLVRKVSTMSVAAAVVGASLIAASVPSQAGGFKVKHHHHGYWPGAVAAGIVGTVALGALAASAAPAYVAADDEGECFTARRRFVDTDGYTFVRRVRVCE